MDQNGIYLGGGGGGGSKESKVTIMNAGSVSLSATYEKNNCQSVS